MECLDNVIGITRKECACFADDKPVGSELSKSGLYLDELSGLSMEQINSSSDCGDGSVWDIMQTAVSNGEIKVRTDLLTLLNANYKDAYSKFSGIVGMRSYNGTLAPSKDLQGLKFSSKDIEGAFFVLKEIDAYFNETTVDEITINIYQKGIEAPLYTFDIDTEANKVKKNILSTPIKLPLHVDGYEDLEYYILYSKHATAKPLNNKLYSCSCTRGKADWSQWDEFSGLNVDTFTSVSELESENVDSYLYGLGLIIQIGCEKSTIICKEGEDSNELFILLKGRLRVTIGQGTLLTYIEPMTLVGEIGVFTDKKRTATVMAYEKSTLMKISKADLFRLFNSNCSMSVRVLINVIAEATRLIL